jgi:two-component system, chemotaxis family, chemotaxis protein CheY
MDNESRQESRKYPRYPFVEDVLIEGTRTCTSNDISEGGLYISAMQCYENNSVIEVTIPFKGEKLTVKAQIQHGQQGIGMGLMFIDLNDEQRSKIKGLIHSIAKKHDKSEIQEKNILLVEDNNTARQAIKGALTKEGFAVIEASDGIEAMKFIAEQNVDLIILDLYMKGIDGLKVLSVLKSNPKWKGIPVIVCSAHDKQEVKERLMNAGADAFIPKKGTSPAQLAESAKTILQKHYLSQ